MTTTVFRLEFKDRTGWSELPLFRCNTLSAAIPYRIVWIQRNVYFDIQDTQQFSCSCVEDLAAFSYWVGYAGYPFVDDLDEERWEEGTADGAADKNL